MTPEEHGKRNATLVHDLLLAKNAKGIKEHGGHLQEMPTLKALYEARDENIDQFSYIQQAIDNTENAVVNLKNYYVSRYGKLDEADRQYLTAIINLLTGE